MTLLRLFIALDLPAGVRATLGALALDPEWRPVPPQNLHVTLVFLGHRAVGDLPRVVEAERTMPELRLGAVVRLGKVLAVDLDDPTGALAAMQARIATALDHDEGRPFRPHVTIARARPRTRPRRPELTVPRQRFHGRSVTLYASQLSSAGARYEALATSYIQP